MPDTLSQHISWDAIKLAVGSAAGFGMLALAWCHGIVTANRKEIEFIKSNYPTRDEVSNDMSACQVDLIRQLESSKDDLMAHIDRSNDSVKELMYLVHPECKPK